MGNCWLCPGLQSRRQFYPSTTKVGRGWLSLLNSQFQDEGCPLEERRRMKVKLKKVYYCDFCGKRSLRSLAKHEKHCTANPNRECRLCGRKDITTLIAKYKNTYEIVQKTLKGWTGPTDFVEWKGVKVTIEDIEADVDGCPNCTLAILRCAFEIPARYEFNYDYKEALKEWWEKEKEGL